MHVFQHSLLELEVVGLGEMIGIAPVEDGDCSFSPIPENHEVLLHQLHRGNVLCTHNLCVFGLTILTEKRHGFAPRKDLLWENVKGNL